MSAPRPRSPSTTAAIRFDSLKRSSSAPRTTVSPSANAPEQRHQRQLVDRERHLLGLHLGALERRRGHVELADRLAVALAAGLLEVAQDHGAHALGDAEEAGAGPVEPHVPRPPRASRARAWPPPRRRPPTTGRRAPRSRPARARRPADTVEPPSVALERHAGAAQHALGVVAARRALDDGRGARRPASRRSARTTSPGRSPPAARTRCPRSSAPSTVKGGKRPSRASTRGAHRPQRLRHPVHRPAPDRLVAVERPDAARAARRASPAAAASACPSCPRRAGRRWPRAGRAARRRARTSSRRRPPPPRRRA